MANITSITKNANQGVFTLDDGTKEITLVNTYGKVICKLHFRPGDVSIYDRYKTLMENFDDIVEPLANINIGNDGTTDIDADWKVLQEVENRVKKQINDLLDSDDADALFATRHPFSSVGGVFFVENVLTVLGKIIAQSIETESKLSEKRVKKYLADVEKDVKPDAGTTADKS